MKCHLEEGLKSFKPHQYCPIAHRESTRKNEVKTFRLRIALLHLSVCPVAKKSKRELGNSTSVFLLSSAIPDYTQLNRGYNQSVGQAQQRSSDGYLNKSFCRPERTLKLRNLSPFQLIWFFRILSGCNGSKKELRAIDILISSLACTTLTPFAHPLTQARIAPCTGRTAPEDPPCNRL